METLIAITNSTGVLQGEAIENSDMFKEAGFTVLQSVEKVLTEGQASKILKLESAISGNSVITGELGFKVSDFTTGSVAVLVLQQAKGVQKMKDLIPNFENVITTTGEVDTLRLKRMLFPTNGSLERSVIVLKDTSDEV
eukprot:jgi/Bigna1/72356/fgenesh1_pg.19_\